MKIFKKFAEFITGKHLCAMAAAVGVILALSSCSDDREEVLPAKPSEEETAVAPRSVLIYMMADNSLGSSGFDRDNLADMIQACADGKFGDSRLIVFHDDRKADHPMLKEVTAKGLKILADLPAYPSTTDKERMQQVVRLFKETAPAEKYGLIIWSHATGWIFPDGYFGLPDRNVVNPLWVGEDKGSYMSLPDMADALSGAGFDYIWFDCCHMASVESLYELRHVADTFVGSASELPAEGMPYSLTLPYLMPKEADPEAAARATFNHYNELSGVYRTCTMSVIDATKLDALAEATSALYSLSPQLPLSYSGQPFERRKENGEPCYLFDFGDYVKALYNATPTPEMRRAYADWLLAMDDCVKYEAATPKIFGEVDIRAHSGLTTFILRQVSDCATKGYDNLGWYADVASNLFLLTND